MENRIKRFTQFESMVHQNTLDQMKRVSDVMGANNIGQRVADDSFANALETTKRDIHKTKIQTYDEYLSEPFAVNQNRVPK
jgi:predicted AAA+ superfamily ATPase